MKIALLVHGQPRFTPAFQILMSQLQGWSQANLYFGLWKSSWAETSEQAFAKIDPILNPGYRIKDILVIDQPDRPLPNPKLLHDTDEYASIRWFYKRRIGMWLSLKLTWDLVKEDYDLIIKIRGEGRLDQNINLNEIDIDQYEMIYPCYPRHGILGGEICDQFLISNKKGMDFYANLINYIDEYIPEVCPEWETKGHDWASEHLLNYYMVKHNKVQHCMNFKHLLKQEGRADCDDKDVHLPIGSNPTKLL
jgi:hypothetical protein